MKKIKDIISARLIVPCPFPTMPLLNSNIGGRAFTLILRRDEILLALRFSI